MGYEFFQSFDAVKEVFREASEMTGMDMAKLIFDSDEEELKRTMNTQPAMITVEIAILETLRSEFGMKPFITAGHSVGEASALYCAGILKREDAFRLIAERARLMERESKKKEGKMYAVLGPEDAVVNAVISKVKDGIVVAANYNTNGQTVISGDASGMDGFMKTVNGENIKARLLELKVSGAWHSPLMSGASEEYAAFVAGLELAEPSVKFIPNVTGAPESDKEAIRRYISRQITSPVKWTGTMGTFLKEGIESVVEIGPGNVLTGLMKRFAPNIERRNVDKLADLENLKNMEM